MKKTSYPLIVAVAGFLIAFAGQSQAESQLTTDDGIAASPKVRQMLQERKARTSAPVVSSQVTTHQDASSANVAASPKVQQMRHEMVIATTPRSTVNFAGYRATGDDGITASPKVRAMLNERRQSVEM